MSQYFSAVRFSWVWLIFLLACNSKDTSKGKPEEYDVKADMSKSSSAFKTKNTDPEIVKAESDSTPITEITFDEKEFDFGKIKEGEKVNHQFSFTNTGTEVLYIYNAAGSCGCTVPQFNTAPVLPGKKDKIDVVFDSKGKKGEVLKIVSVRANTYPSSSNLIIKAHIE